MRRFEVSLPTAIFAIIFVAASSMLSTWYWTDRDAFITASCEAGLPNFTKPAQLAAPELECVPFNSRQSGFGYVNSAEPGTIILVSEDTLDPKAHLYGGYDDSAVLKCQAIDCEDLFRDQFAATFVEGCPAHEQAKGFAGVRLKGWLTSVYSAGEDDQNTMRTFVADEVVEVFAPTDQAMAEWSSTMQRCREALDEDAK
ncbi:MAG: hypothetical protein AAGK17_02010 [Pseudomonadota bacterium]